MYRYTSLMVIALCIGANSAFAREWTDSTGNYTVQADFVSQTGGTVTLRRENGKLVKVPLQRLSQADQQYVEQWQFSIAVPNGLSFVRRGNITTGTANLRHVIWILQRDLDQGTRDTIIIIQREDEEAIGGVHPDFPVAAAQLVLGLNRAPPSTTTIRVPEDETSVPKIFFLVEPEDDTKKLPVVRAGMTFVDTDTTNYVIVSASRADNRPIFEKRSIDDGAAQLARTLKGAKKSELSDTAREVWKRILLEDRVFSPAHIEGVQSKAADLKPLLGNSNQYMAMTIPSKAEKLPSIERVVQIYGEPDRKETKDGDELYVYGQIVLATKKGGKDIHAIGAPFNWFLQGLKTAAQSE